MSKTSAQHRELVAVWKEYFDQAEELDRRYPHRPGPDKAVLPYPRDDLSDKVRQKRAEEFQALVDTLKSKTNGAPKDVDLAAKREAEHLHYAELTSCDCELCSRGPKCALCRDPGHDRRQCPRQGDCICPYDPRSPVQHKEECPLRQE